MARFLTHSEAREYYDRFAGRQDKQGFYEDAALDRLRACGDFGSAESVLDFGCGTGRFARQLLDDELGPDSHLTGIDASPTMVEIARRRLASFGDRTTVNLTDGQPVLDQPDSSFDRFVACYVFDLLSPEVTARVVAEAHRVLMPGGMLCVVGLTPGPTFSTGTVSALWSAVHRLRPELVGGCRPIRFAKYLDRSAWTTVRREVASGYMVSSEILIARPE